MTGVVSCEQQGCQVWRRYQIYINLLLWRCGDVECLVLGGERRESGSEAAPVTSHERDRTGESGVLGTRLARILD